MARGKRKKYPKLPNGYGSIKYLGSGRRNPYAVHPPSTGVTLTGSPITPKALCYVDNWMKGFAVLTALKAGTYFPGMELELNLKDESEDLNSLAQKILADYSQSRPVERAKQEKEKTFAKVYEEFYRWKFVDNQKRQYAKNTVNSITSAYKRLAPLHDKIFCELTHDDLQGQIDSSELSHAAIEHDLNLIKQMCKYALIKGYIEKNPSQFVAINKADDDEHGVPFSDEELEILWMNQENPVVEFILIMCYSGYRIKAYQNLEINVEKQYFKGGIKTKVSKNRIVPIHSAIFPIVNRRMELYHKILPCSTAHFREKMYATLAQIGIQKHTPHDCRHTFSRLCEKYCVNENDRRRMLGHSFGADITNSTYGHRELADLRKEIEKIQIG